jgi:hypothetical protein
MKGVLPWSVHLARCSGNTDFYPAFPALISLVQTFFCSTLFHFMCSQQPGQAVVPSPLSANMCLWLGKWCVGEQWGVHCTINLKAGVLTHE